MEAIGKRERIEAVVRGERPDRAPFAVWRHFPGDDQNAEALARATADFQRRFDCDLIKVSPSSSFSVEDWGVETEYQGNQEGTRRYLSRPITSADDWLKLQVLDVMAGALGRQLDCLRMVRADFGHDVPIIQTVFNPLSMARYLTGDRFILDLRRSPDKLHSGLHIIAETTAIFVQEALKTGIDGIFLAVQQASYSILSEAEYQEFGVQYDRQVLDAASDGNFKLLHIHGNDVMFDLLAQYPVQAVNWHDRTAGPSLADARERFPGALVGGLSQWETLLKGSPSEVEAEVADALAQTGGKGHIIGAGCVIPITIPEGNIHAIRQSLR
jgi:uroporphyrinogen decarboxylase